MTISSSKSKNSITYYMTKSERKNGKTSSRVIERLGNMKEMEERFGTVETITKAKEYVKN